MTKSKNFFVGVRILCFSLSSTVLIQSEGVARPNLLLVSLLPFLMSFWWPFVFLNPVGFDRCHGNSPSHCYCSATMILLP